MKIKIKRLIAGIMSIMLVMTVINFAEIIKIGASEVSGYKIDVTYSEDNSIATLTANTKEVKNNVQLKTLTDENGSEFIPQDFLQEIRKNGNYKFILNYTETVGETAQEKQQEITVKVDGIMPIVEFIDNPFTEPTEPIVVPPEQPAETPAEPQPEAPAETPAEPQQPEQPAETPTEPQQPEAPAETPTEPQQPEAPAETPAEPQQPEVLPAPTTGETVPLDVLKASMAKYIQSRADQTIQTYKYTTENKIKLGGYKFAGGQFSTSTLPAEANRIFDKAIFKYNNSITEFVIAGLYYYEDPRDSSKNGWYYSTTNINNKEEGTVGYKLPNDVGTEADQIEIRLYYKLSSSPLRNIKVGDGLDADLYNVYVDGNKMEAGNTTKALPGAKVVVVFSKPTKNKALKIKIMNKINGQLIEGKVFDTANLTGTGLTDLSGLRYSAVFDMPNNDVEIWKEDTLWPSDANYSFGLQTGEDPSRQNSSEDGSIKIESIKGHLPNENAYTEVGPELDNYSKSTRNDLQYRERKGTYVTKKSAMGRYHAGDPIEFKVTGTRFLPGTSYTGWRKIPRNVILDVYVGQQITGTDFHSYSIILHENQGETQTQEIKDLGLKVSVTCNEYNMPNYSLYAPFKTVHTIKIEGMYHNFKLSVDSQSTLQQTVIIDKMEGVIQGDSKNSNLANISSVNFKADGGSPRDAMLRQNDSYLQKEDPVTFKIKPKYGYSKPKVTITNNRGLSFDTSDAPNENGKYSFKLNFAPTNDDLRPIQKIQFTSQPIKFEIYYKYNDQIIKIPGTNDDAYVQPFTLEDSRYYSIAEYFPTLPDGTYFTDYKLSVFGDNTFTNPILNNIENPATSTTSWRPHNIIDMEKVIYDKLAEKGSLADIEKTYTVVLSAQTSNTTTGALVSGKYQIRKQTSFSNTDNSISTNLEKDTYSYTEQEVKAYQGSTVNMIGYKPTFPDGNKKYRLIPKTTKSSAVLETPNTVFLWLEYALYVNIDVDKASLGTSNNWDTWIKTNDKMYTSINNLDHEVDLPALVPGTRDGEKFTGWAIKDSNGKEYPIITDMMYGKNLNFFVLGGKQKYKALWEDIFLNGTCTLVAQWETEYGPITSNNVDSSIKDENNYDVGDKASVTYTGNGYDVSATFKYTGDWNAQKANIKVALFKTNAGDVEKNNPGLYDKLWATEEGAKNAGQVTGPDGSSKIDKVEFDKNSDIVDNGDGTVTVIFHIKEIDETSPVITDEWDDGAQWTIYAWNDKNGYDDNAANVKNQWGVTGTGKKVPAVRNKSVVYPAPIKGMDGLTGDMTGTEVKFKEEPDASFTLTAKFKVDEYYPFNEMWGNSGQTIGENIHENKKINLALYKKNPGGSQSFKLWDTESKDAYPATHNKKVDPPKVTNNNGVITVTWKIKDDGTGSLNATWDNNAEYRIYAYNKQNDNYIEKPNDQLPVENSWPSVTTTTKMEYQEPAFYVSVPKHVNMMDESAGNKASGNGEVTYETFDPSGSVTNFPYIRVEMKSPIVLNPYEYDGSIISGEKSINPDLYRTSEDIPAKEYTSSDDNRKYIVLGILADLESSKPGYPQTKPGYGLVPAGKQLGFTLKTDKVLGKRILYKGAIEYRFTILETIENNNGK